MIFLYLVTPGEKWSHGKLEFMLSQRGKPLLVHDGHSFGIQYIRKDKKYWWVLIKKYNGKNSFEIGTKTFKNDTEILNRRKLWEEHFWYKKKIQLIPIFLLQAMQFVSKIQL